jgi:hypothetical protein
MRIWRRLAGMLLAGLALPALAAGDIITATQITTFQGMAVGQPVGKLIWRGGLNLTSQSDAFGGLSGLGFTSPDHKLTMVSDRGNFISGQLLYDENNLPFSLVGVTIDPIQNSKGVALPRAYARDAEALNVILRDGVPAAIRVGFENLTRVADFELTNGVPGGPATEITVPQWLADTRTNASLEAVCIAPAASPIAGSTLLLTEGIIDDDGEHSAWLLGQNDKGPLTYISSDGVNPTDCTFLPNGDLLVLERGIAFLTFTMKLKRIPAADVKPGAHLQGEILLEALGADIDNMEALATHTGPDGDTLITLVSDNNFNDWERNLLLEFSLAE